jgi:ABC-type molybdenum transport system, ATPase component/photorepair protein PhrA
MKSLEMKNVSVIRDEKRILNSISLDVDQDENIAIIGKNGSGKTTLIKLLRCEIYPYNDEWTPFVLKIFGEERWNVFTLRNKMGVVSMDLQNMFRDNTKVFEVIASGFFGSLDIFRNMHLTEAMMEKVNEKAIIMGIDELLDRDIGTLSLGEMRRALIARALVTEPMTLVLDEPMTGLDIVMSSKFRMMFDILIGIGVRVIMITHDLADIPESIGRVVMLKDGKVFADGKKEDLLTSETVSKLYDEPIKVENDNGIYRMCLKTR